MCLLPYSNPSVCSSEYISSYLILSPCHFPILIFNLQFSLTFHTQTDQNLLIFFKIKESIWSHSFVYFLISVLFISKPTEQTAGSVCGIPLSQIFPKYSATQLPILEFI